MAKKVVAGLRKVKDRVKLIRTVKSPKTGNYSFHEEMVAKDQLQEALNRK